MSTSSSRYDVEENRRRRQRAVVAARQEADQVRAQIADLRRRVVAAAASYGFDQRVVTVAEPSAPISNEDVEGHQRFLAALRVALVGGEQALAAVAHQARTTEMLGALAASYDPNVALEASDSTLTESSTIERLEKAEVEERSAVAIRVMARLHDAVGDDRRREVESLASSLVTASRSRAEGLEMELRRVVQTANEEAEQCEAERLEAARLRVALLGLEGDEVAQADALLSVVEAGRGRLTASLRRQVAVARERSEQVDDRQYAADTTVAVLERLGYEVEEGFETAFVEDGTFYFQRGNWGDYVVRLRVDADQSRLDFDMRRMDDGGSTDVIATEVRDHEMERAWCDAVPELVGALAEEGIDLDVEQRPPRPGRLATVPRERVGLRGDESAITDRDQATEVARRTERTQQEKPLS